MANEFWDLDRIYVFEGDNHFFYTFTSPDGIGKVFHKTQHHAKGETGINSVVYLMGAPLDFCAEKEENGTCIHSDHTP